MELKNKAKTEELIKAAKLLFDGKKINISLGDSVCHMNVGDFDLRFMKNQLGYFTCDRFSV